jgi:hypothetical protein
MSATSEFYRARAAESAAQAEATSLDNVRERCLRAEAAWLLMAERLTRAEVSRREQAVEKAERDQERLAGANS